MMQIFTQGLAKPCRKEVSHAMDCRYIIRMFSKLIGKLVSIITVNTCSQKQ